MANPKKRMTSTRSGNRRSHLALTLKKLARCPKCKEAVLPHHICLNCGSYKGEEVINLDKKQRKFN